MRYLDIPVEVRSSGENEISQIEVFVSDENLLQTIAHFFMLEQHTIERLTLKTNLRGKAIDIYLDESTPRPDDRMSGKDNRLQIYLSKETFEYIAGYLLKYFRDRRAESDHVDIELDLIAPLFCDDNSRPYLIFCVDRNKVQISGQGYAETLDILWKQK